MCTVIFRFQYQRFADKFDNLKGVISWARRSRFKKYQQLCDEQEDIKNGHVLLQTIARALDLMPNISSIVYSQGPRHLPIERKDMREIVPPCSFAAQDGFHHLIGAVYISQYTGVREFRVEFNRDVRYETNGKWNAFKILIAFIIQRLGSCLQLHRSHTCRHAPTLILN